MGSKVPVPVPGLCCHCAHVRVTGNRRGSRFRLCEMAKTDSRFQRYPLLPVLHCLGFERAGPDPWAGYDSSEEEDA